MFVDISTIPSVECLMFITWAENENLMKFIIRKMTKSLKVLRHASMTPLIRWHNLW